MSQSSPSPAQAAIKATIGRRQQQQDTARQTRIRLEDGHEALLLIVADGMGGAVGGQVASSRAVDAFAAYAAASEAPVGERLRGALNAANDAIAHAIAMDPRLSGMGSTLIGAVVDGARLDWVSVGDSLLLSVEGGEVQRLNADHSLGGVLDRQAERGEITLAEAETSDQRHLLRSALTGEPIPLVDSGSAVLDETALLLVASDGVLTLPFDRLAEIVSAAATLDAAAGEVVEAIEAIAVEDQDNMTIAVAAPSRAGPADGAPDANGARALHGEAIGRDRERTKPRRWLAIAMLIVGMLVMAAAGYAAYRLLPPAKQEARVRKPEKAPAPVPMPKRGQASPAVEEYRYPNTFNTKVSGTPTKPVSKPEPKAPPRPQPTPARPDQPRRPAAQEAPTPGNDGPDQPGPNDQPAIAPSRAPE